MKVIGFDIGFNSPLAYADNSGLTGLIKIPEKYTIRLDELCYQYDCAMQEGGVGSKIITKKYKEIWSPYVLPYIKASFELYDFVIVEDLGQLSIKKDFGSKEVFGEVSYELRAKMMEGIVASFNQYQNRGLAKLIKIPAPYTSQTCSSCLNQKSNTSYFSEFKCSNCKMVMDRDLNAALNILRVGMRRVPAT